jgi:hypothetical protein
MRYRNVMPHNDYNLLIETFMPRRFEATRHQKGWTVNKRGAYCPIRSCCLGLGSNPKEKGWLEASFREDFMETGPVMSS